MIVKSMSGKRGRGSFAALVRYMLKPGPEEERANEVLIKHNLRSPSEDWQSLVAELEDNARLQRPGRGRVLYFHEVISPHPEDGHLVSDELLEDLGREYLAMRAPEALAVAAVHRDIERENRPHLHICISGNLIRSQKQLRLSKTDFRDTQHELEAYQAEHYPELTHSLVFSREREREPQQAHRQEYKAEARRRKDREAQRRRRLQTEQDKPLSRKEQVKAQVATCIQAANSQDELKQALANLGLALYQRGKTPGVQDINTGKKYRLKTLGVLEDMENRAKAWQTEKDRAARAEERMRLLDEDRKRGEEREREKGGGRGRGVDNGEL